MSALRRLCLLVFGLAGLVAVAVTALPELGIAEAAIASLTASFVGRRVVAGCCVILFAGLLVCLARAVLTPHNARSVEVSTVGGDRICVSREAIRAQVVHLVESDGTLAVRGVTVRARQRGHVRVKVRVRPTSVVNVAACGAELHARLVEGLAVICGDTVERVDIEFVQAASLGGREDLDDLDEFEGAYDEFDEGHAFEEDVPATPVSPVPVSEDITVSMGRAASSAPAASAHVEGGK